MTVSQGAGLVILHWLMCGAFSLRQLNKCERRAAFLVEQHLVWSRCFAFRLVVFYSQLCSPGSQGISRTLLFFPLFSNKGPSQLSELSFTPDSHIWKLKIFACMKEQCKVDRLMQYSTLSPLVSESICLTAQFICGSQAGRVKLTQEPLAPADRAFGHVNERFKRICDLSLLLLYDSHCTRSQYLSQRDSASLRRGEKHSFDSNVSEQKIIKCKSTTVTDNSQNKE